MNFWGVECDKDTLACIAACSQGVEYADGMARLARTYLSTLAPKIKNLQNWEECCMLKAEIGMFERLLRLPTESAAKLRAKGE